MTSQLALRLWEQAGESPHEVLMEENLYTDFEDILNQNVVENVTLFRGINVEKGRRFESIKQGDVLTYEVATSWSLDKNIAENCVSWNPTILVWDVNKATGIFNDENTYGEQELIMASQSFLVDKIDGKFVHVVIPKTE